MERSWWADRGLAGQEIEMGGGAKIAPAPVLRRIGPELSNWTLQGQKLAL
jgi:hypothetical protein